MAKTKPSKQATAGVNELRNRVRAVLTQILADGGGCVRISALPISLIRDDFEIEERDFAELEVNFFLATLDQQDNPFHMRVEEGKIFICLDAQ